MVKGVIAEFNPFHNGHLYQINNIEGDIKICVLSSNICQRGEYPILDKFTRSELAILNGYDIVVELPFYYSLQNAEIFSKKAVDILNVLKVDEIVCGVENSESEIISLLNALSKKEINESIKEKLKQGLNYNKSIKDILEERNIFSYKSNNILAMEYTKRIEEKKYNMSISYMKRKSVYHTSLEVVNNISSASYIRNNLDKKEIKNLVPESTFEKLKKTIDVNYDVYYNILKYLFLYKDLSNIYDMKQDIYNFMKKNILNSDSYAEYLKKIKCKNFGLNRIRRIEKNVIYNISKNDILKENDIEYIRVLAINEKGSKYLKNLNSNKIFSNFKDIEKNISSNLIKIEKKSFILNKMILNIDEKLNNIYEEKK